MVKSGEVYSVDEAMLDERNGFLYGRDDRPRGIKAGTNKGCGILAAIQGYLWEMIYKAFPGLI